MSYPPRKKYRPDYHGGYNSRLGDRLGFRPASTSGHGHGHENEHETTFEQSQLYLKEHPHLIALKEELAALELSLADAERRLETELERKRGSESQITEETESTTKTLKEHEETSSAREHSPSFQMASKVSKIAAASAADEREVNTVTQNNHGHNLVDLTIVSASKEPQINGEKTHLIEKQTAQSAPNIERITEPEIQHKLEQAQKHKPEGEHERKQKTEQENKQEKLYNSVKEDKKGETEPRQEEEKQHLEHDQTKDQSIEEINLPIEKHAQDTETNEQSTGAHDQVNGQATQDQDELTEEHDQSIEVQDSDNNELELEDNDEQEGDHGEDHEYDHEYDNDHNINDNDDEHDDDNKKDTEFSKYAESEATTSAIPKSIATESTYISSNSNRSLRQKYQFIIDKKLMSVLDENTERTIWLNELHLCMLIFGYPKLILNAITAFKHNKSYNNLPEKEAEFYIKLLLRKYVSLEHISFQSSVLSATDQVANIYAYAFSNTKDDTSLHRYLWIPKNTQLMIENSEVLEKYLSKYQYDEFYYLNHQGNFYDWYASLEIFLDQLGCGRSLEKVIQMADKERKLCSVTPEETEYVLRMFCLKTIKVLELNSGWCAERMIHKTLSKLGFIKKRLFAISRLATLQISNDNFDQFRENYYSALISSKVSRVPIDNMKIFQTILKRSNDKYRRFGVEYLTNNPQTSAEAFFEYLESCKDLVFETGAQFELDHTYDRKRGRKRKLAD